MIEDVGAGASSSTEERSARGYPTFIAYYGHGGRISESLFDRGVGWCLRRRFFLGTPDAHHADPGGFELQQRELASLYRHAHATSLQDGRQRMPHSQACRSGCLTPLIGEHSRTVISFRSTSAATAHDGRCTYVETDRLARPGEGGARPIGLPVERDATTGENFEEDDRHRAFTPRPR